MNAKECLELSMNQVGFSFNRISDFFVVVVIVVVQEVLHEHGFSELRASRAKNLKEAPGQNMYISIECSVSINPSVLIQ